ncbi:DUF2934 domain-containing protein [Stenotrophomonas sp. C3(2023)]|nr:DUF2934 domain-containing protein [Stenotrophomonas sp. C3(2023)]
METDQRQQWLQQLAYQVWEARGRPHDGHQQDWRVAERLLDAELALRHADDTEDRADVKP